MLYPKFTTKKLVRAAKAAIATLEDDPSTVAKSALVGFILHSHKKGSRDGLALFVDIRRFDERKDLESIARQMVIPKRNGNKSVKKLKFRKQ